MYAVSHALHLASFQALEITPPFTVRRRTAKLSTKRALSMHHSLIKRPRTPQNKHRIFFLQPPKKSSHKKTKKTASTEIANPSRATIRSMVPISVTAVQAREKFSRQSLLLDNPHDNLHTKPTITTESNYSRTQPEH